MSHHVSHVFGCAPIKGRHVGRAYQPAAAASSQPLTSLAEQLGIGPVEPGSRAGEDAAARGEQIDELGVPLAHLAARGPEGPEDGGEVAPPALPQRADELWPLAFRGAGADHVEGGREGRVRLRVVLYRVADVQHHWFPRWGRHLGGICGGGGGVGWWWSLRDWSLFNYSGVLHGC